MKQPRTECKFKVNDYVETVWGVTPCSDKGYRGQVTDTFYHKRKGWRIVVDFSRTMSHNYPNQDYGVSFYQNDLRLVKQRQWLWFEVVVDQFKRWFKKRKW